MIYLLCEDCGRDVDVPVLICEGPDGLDLEKLQKDFIKELIGDPPVSYELYSSSPENEEIRKQWLAWTTLKEQRCRMDLFLQRHGLSTVDYKEVPCLL